MPKPFSAATAEQVVVVVQAVVAAGSGPVNAQFVADYADLQLTTATAALALAVDLGFLSETGGDFMPASPLCRFSRTPKVAVKAAVLRVALESYRPFLVFRTELRATDDPAAAAERTRVVLDLGAHRDEILATLISLGTFAQALVATGGGHHRPEEGAFGDPLLVLAQEATDQAAAEAQIRSMVGDLIDTASREHVLEPMADALLKAAAGDGRGAITVAGNAIESLLVEVADRVGVVTAGATGLTSKMDRFGANIPKKVQAVGRYLGNLRNAADHGIDNDIGVAWQIRDRTGLEYVYVACSFATSLLDVENSRPMAL